MTRAFNVGERVRYMTAEEASGTGLRSSLYGLKGTIVTPDNGFHNPLKPFVKLDSNQNLPREGLFRYPVTKYLLIDSLSTEQLLSEYTID